MEVVLGALGLVALILAVRRWGSFQGLPNEERKQRAEAVRKENEEGLQRQREYEEYRASQQQPWDPSVSAQALEEQAAWSRQRQDELASTYQQQMSEGGGWQQQQAEQYAASLAQAGGPQDDWAQRQRHELEQRDRLHGDLLLNDEISLRKRQEEELAADNERRSGYYGQLQADRESWERERDARYSAERGGAFSPEPYTPEPYAPPAYSPEPYAPEPYRPEPYQPEPYRPEPYQPEPYRPDPYGDRY